MFSFKNKEGVKKSNDLHESGKKVVAKTNERVFEHLLIDGEEPVRKLLPLSDSLEEVVNDGCYHQQQTIAVEVFTDACWAHKREVAEMLMNDKTFFGRAAYLDDCMHLVWVVQKTNNLPLMHWKIAIENYLNKHHGLGCSFQDLTAEEYLYDSIEIQFYLCKFQPITHIEYFTYEHGEQNAHAHSVFPDCKNEGKNNVSN